MNSNSSPEYKMKTKYLEKIIWSLIKKSSFTFQINSTHLDSVIKKCEINFSTGHRLFVNYTFPSKAPPTQLYEYSKPTLYTVGLISLEKIELYEIQQKLREIGENNSLNTRLNYEREKLRKRRDHLNSNTKGILELDYFLNDFFLKRKLEKLYKNHLKEEKKKEENIKKEAEREQREDLLKEKEFWEEYQQNLHKELGENKGNLSILDRDPMVGNLSEEEIEEEFSALIPDKGK